MRKDQITLSIATQLIPKRNEKKKIQQVKCAARKPDHDIWHITVSRGSFWWCLTLMVPALLHYIPVNSIGGPSIFNLLMRKGFWFFTLTLSLAYPIYPFWQWDYKDKCGLIWIILSKMIQILEIRLIRLWMWAKVCWILLVIDYVNILKRLSC